MSRQSSSTWPVDTVSPKNAVARLGELVRLVEDHRVARRQQLRHAFVAQHDIGEEEVVVDDDDVGGERVPPRLHDEAAVEVPALAPEAVVARGGRERPGRRVLGHVSELRLVARARLRGEARDPLQVARGLAGGEPAVLEVAFEMVRADVVGAALEQRHGHRQPERLADRREIAVEELVLERLGAGRNDDLAAEEQRRHEVGNGLAGAGARFGEEHAPLAHRARDARGHLALLLARAVVGNRAAERSVGREDGGERGVGVACGHLISSTFTQTDEPAVRAPEEPERTPDCERVDDWSMPPSGNHSPSRPLAVVESC